MLIVAGILLLAPILVNSQNNVCDTIESYANINNSSDCRYDPRVGKHTIELILLQGYSYNNYTVETEDGYMLTIHRVFKNDFGKRVVFMHHGIYADSTSFTISGNNSLAFRLVDLGYDVWLGNSRGTPSSMGHRNKKITPKEYWDFSFHEIAIYDVPAVLSMITQITQSKILLIGYSMGTTISFIYASLMKEHSEAHLKAIVSMAPVAYFDRWSSSIAFFANLHIFILGTANLLNIYDVNGDEMLRTKIRVACSTHPLIDDCSKILIDIFGVSDEFSPNMIPVALTGITSGSLKTLDHYAQILESKGTFAQYSYGAFANRHLYGSYDPPLYPVRNIELPVRLFYGSSDPLCSEKSVMKLMNTISSTDKLMFKVPSDGSIKFNHADFVGATHVDELFVVPFLKVIDELYQ